MEEGRGRAWLPAMVHFMVEVFNQMRCDRPNNPEPEVHVADVPLPVLRDNCKWCKIWDEDDTYEPVEFRKPVEEKIDQELATIEMTSAVGDNIAVREKIYTYEEISEKDGRREKTLNDDDWGGRSEGRLWRGRSKSRCREEDKPQWRGRSIERRRKVIAGEEGWRGRVRSQDRAEQEWGGRVRSPEREIVIESRDREWRGRSPGVGSSYWG
eukprot:GFUD01036804.1.p1 GENE.GFUD01036804.1~~GFUD01036804.1.p1  ORF type:complete len:211 (+),score=66.03 GFUD01036804.1:53-685(+)